MEVLVRVGYRADDKHMCYGDFCTLDKVILI